MFFSAEKEGGKRERHTFQPSEKKEKRGENHLRISDISERKEKGGKGDPASDKGRRGKGHIPNQSFSS